MLCSRACYDPMNMYVMGGACICLYKGIRVPALHSPNGSPVIDISFWFSACLIIKLFFLCFLCEKDFLVKEDFVSNYISPSHADMFYVYFLFYHTGN